METQNFDYEAGNRRLMRVFYTIAGLWVALVPVLVLILPNINLLHHLWLGFLLANLTVWPVVFIAGAVAEGVRGIRAARISMKRARREREANALPSGPLVME